MSDARFAIVNGTIVLPDRLIPDGMICWAGDRITSVGRRRRLSQAVTVMDASGGYVTPGFIDIHVHGGGGADFMDGTEQGVVTSCEAHLRHGTTTLFPTTTTGSADLIHAMIDACAAVRKTQRSGRASGSRIAGIHLYGPYFAEDKVGCHPASGRRSPEVDEYRSYFATKQIRIATCAAELPGAAAFFKAAKKSKCLITCGHSNSSWAEMQSAFDCGMRHVDHFWCAMSSVPSVRQRLGVPMQGSMAEFVLLNREMSTEVIADGCHLAPELLEFAWRMKGADRLCLVTDCNRALDMPPGEYWFGSESEGSRFRSDGRVGWAPNGSLASSIVGMDHMVRHMASVTTADLPSVIRMATLTPAERTGISATVGSLEVGKQADLLILSPDLTVQTVIQSGQRQHG